MKTTNPGPLKQVSQDFFAEQQLPDNTLERFEQLLSSTQKKEQSFSKKEGTNSSDNRAVSRRLTPFAIAAGIVAIAGLSSVWFIPSVPPTDAILLSSTSPTSHGIHQQRMVAAIASEVTKNHIKLKPLEVTSQNFSKVRDYFTQLDFAPQVSTHFPKLTRTELTMMGGRYCSIQSETAAQLRYQATSATPTEVEPVTSSETPWSTLYQTQYKPNTFGELPQVEQGQTPIETYSRGLKVNIWVERQLLMVSVEDALE